jgi:hypothetical protein
MTQISPEISELCRRTSMVSYLEKRGVHVMTYGKSRKCCCPLPEHRDDTPSFYIYDAADGGEVFKCFGCGVSGNIISLIAKIEGKKNGEVVRQLAEQTGVTLGEYDPSMRTEPYPDEILASFCAEDAESLVVSMLLRDFIQVNNGSEDAVNKACRIYQMWDDFSDYGDGEYTQQKYGHLGIKNIYDVETYAINLVRSYRDRSE